jgi:hypothetical protein
MTDVANPLQRKKTYRYIDIQSGVRSDDPSVNTMRPARHFLLFFKTVINIIIIVSFQIAQGLVKLEVTYYTDGFLYFFVL